MCNLRMLVQSLLDDVRDGFIVAPKEFTDININFLSHQRVFTDYSSECRLMKGFHLLP